MLIIFDLDDTLIQTTATFTPHQLRRAVYKMVDKGLAVPDLKEAMAHIHQLDTTTSSTQETLILFLNDYGQREDFIDIGLKEAYENFSFDFPIMPTEGAQEILIELKNEHTLVLVSAGVPIQQMAKMEKAGIDSALFSKIAICQKSEKGAYYRSFFEELGSTPADVLVCGDRVAIDLAPAKALGFWTVQIKQGRGASRSSSQEGADFTIFKLAELKRVLNQIEPLKTMQHLIKLR